MRSAAGTSLPGWHHGSRLIPEMRLGITVTGGSGAPHSRRLVVGFIAEPSVSALLEPALTGVGVPQGAVGGISVALAFVAATVVQMVLGAPAPKNLALAVPERPAKSLAGSTLAYLKAVGPVVRVFDGVANRLLSKVGIEPVEELHHGATLAELGHLIGESHEQGELPKDTAELPDHALEFSERTLDEVMVPRVAAVFVREDASAAEAVELIAKYGHSNYPVLGDHPDDVTGVLGVRELMRLPAEPLTAATAGALARRPLLLPGHPALPAAVTRMQEQEQEQDDEFAVVLDEHGGVAGIVTYEDVAEELVGVHRRRVRHRHRTRRRRRGGLAGGRRAPPRRGRRRHGCRTARGGGLRHRRRSGRGPPRPLPGHRRPAHRGPARRRAHGHRRTHPRPARTTRPWPTRSTSCVGIAPPSPSSATTRAASPGWSAWTTCWRAICNPGRPDRPPSAHRASTVR